MKARCGLPRSIRAITAALFRPRVILVVALFGWYLNSVVDPRLLFESRDKLFLWNLHFFTDFTGQPGTLLEWMDSLLVQLCGTGWPAALAMAVAAWLLMVSTDGLMTATARSEAGGAWLIPVIALFAFYSDYLAHTSVIFGSALAIIAANGWVRMPTCKSWLRVVLFAAVALVLCYVAGGTSFCCFAACCIVSEALARKRWRSVIWMLLTSFALKLGLDALLARFDFHTRNFQPPALDEFRAAPLTWQVALFHAYFPACAAFLLLRQATGSAAHSFLRRICQFTGNNILAVTGKARRHAKPSRRQRAVPPAAWKWLRWTAGTVLILSLATAAGFRALDRETKTVLEISFCSDHQMWDAVLEKARRLPLSRYFSSSANHEVNLALYHTGRLPYEMFLYPQSQTIWALIDYLQVPNQLIRKPCDFYLELGRVNEAEHMALEMSEMWPTGGALKRLALVKMIKGQAAAARPYLNVLQDDLVWGRWAQAYLHRLTTDPDLDKAEEIQRIRRLMIDEDDLQQNCRFTPDGGTMLNLSTLLLNQVKQNGQNRMAFEYLMARCLMRGYLQDVVALLPLLDAFPYPAIPTLYEEAALIYGLERPGQIVDTPSGISIHGRRISEQTATRFHKYLAILSRYGKFNKEAGPILARHLGGSYFQYDYLNRSRTVHD